ncbi:MAG: aromatic ring hydroxylase [Thermoprotei archaeon]|nr:MAG: aromatic ring hydroxylase [Thermoprotei archaeon]
MVSKEEIVEKIRENLKKVIDPEIGLNVVDSGFIRGIKVDDEGNVEVDLMLTTPFCPIAHIIVASIEERTREVEEVKNVKVNIVGFGIPPELEKLMEERYKRMIEALKEEES